MPELPEVETVRRSLENHLIGQKVSGVKVFLPKIIRYQEGDLFAQNLTRRQFIELTRRGKYLIAHLSEEQSLVVHLGMAGSFIYRAEDFSPQEYAFKEEHPRQQGILRHVHVVIHLEDYGILYFHDLRQFGYLTLCKTAECFSLKGLKDLGPEPLGKDFYLDSFAEKVINHKTKIKQLLLDQKIVAGIGNIYADEILFAVGIHPERSGSSLTPDELQRMHRAIIAVLQKGVDYRGTSISDYVDGEGRPGGFQEHLQVYQRNGQPCGYCSTIIERVKVSGRSSHFCPHCQK